MLTDESARLQTAIDTLEAQRPILGDAVVEAALGSMREKLAALAARAQPAQQRKQATVLFADVSGFTALSERLDAEDVASIMNELWALVDRAIIDHGGRIDKHLGDGIMALWGADVAREDDPEQAVRAALAMRAAVYAFCESQRVPVAMRIGVNTGPALLGTVGTTGEFTAMGDAVNLASRLEHAAPAGGILISHDTYRHVRGVFSVRPQEPLVVKGKAEPVQTYIVTRAKPRAFRMATRGVEGVETRMIGREAELLALQSAHTDAIESSETRVALIVGEAGVGKSRLLYEFDNWLELRPESVYYFKGRGTPNMQSVTHGLFRDLFAFRFGILDSDSTAVALDKFRQGMDGILEPEQADVVGHWLGFDFSASEAVALLPGSGLAATARVFLTRYFQALAAGGPVAIFLEDIHWADDPSLDLALHLAKAISAVPLLIVVVARPSFFERHPLWGEGEAALRRINLRPLPKQASRALVDEVLQRVEVIPDRLRELIIDSAEGNPFYVEEMIKMMIEQGVIEREQQGSDAEETEPSPDAAWRVREDRLENVKVPPTLTRLLQARVDGLPRPEREALQRASVVGRLFWDDAVADLLQTDLEAVEPAFKTMRERELIFRREHSAFAHTGEYIFKHALLRDVVYETVLLKYRADFHGRVARWLESHAGERRDEYLGLIAEHYIQANEGLKAAPLLEQSGSEALRVGASASARQAFERALALREVAGETSGAVVSSVRIKLGRACERLGNYAAAEAVVRQGLASAREAGDADLESEALAGLSRLAAYRGDFDSALALAGEALQLGRVAGGWALVHAVGCAGYTAWQTGDMETAAALAEEYLTLARETGDVDVEASAINILGIIAGARGELERSGQLLEEALASARLSNNLYNEAHVLLNLGHVHNLRGDLDVAKSYTTAAADRFRELSQPSALATALINLSGISLKLGDKAEARRTLSESVKTAQSIGDLSQLAASLPSYADLLISENEVGRGLAVYGLALAHPALEVQDRMSIEEEITGLGLSPAEVEAGLAAGASLDFDAVVQEIMALPD